jgi:dephospho-CoA kinase
MKIVGLTGGIGSGKSVVARVFEVLGVPVYSADEAGRRLLNQSA